MLHGLDPTADKCTCMQPAPSIHNPVTDHPFSGMSSPPALIHKRKRNEVTADAASQDATPPPKKATHPEDYTLTCCICRKEFTGATLPQHHNLTHRHVSKVPFTMRK
jgi:hypothetical protein